MVSSSVSLIFVIETNVMPLLKVFIKSSFMCSWSQFKINRLQSIMRRFVLLRSREESGVSFFYHLPTVDWVHDIVSYYHR